MPPLFWKNQFSRLFGDRIPWAWTLMQQPRCTLFDPYSTSSLVGLLRQVAYSLRYSSITSRRFVHEIATPETDFHAFARLYAYCWAFRWGNWFPFEILRIRLTLPTPPTVTLPSFFNRSFLSFSRTF